MRLNKYLSGAAILSLISSCTYYIPLDNVNEPSKLVLYCYPGNGENTVVRLSRSLPVGSKNIPEFSAERTEVHFFLNGEEAASSVDGRLTSPESRHRVSTGRAD